MDFLKKFFPLSFKFNKDLKTFIISLVIYVVAGPVYGIVCGITTPLFGIGIILAFLAPIVDLYCLAGIVFSILVFAKVFKVEAAEEIVEVEAAEAPAEEAPADAE